MGDLVKLWSNRHVCQRIHLATSKDGDGMVVFFTFTSNFSHWWIWPSARGRTHLPTEFPISSQIYPLIHHDKTHFHMKSLSWNPSQIYLRDYSMIKSNARDLITTYFVLDHPAGWWIWPSARGRAHLQTEFPISSQIYLLIHHDKNPLSHEIPLRSICENSAW